jgi:peptidoglycan/xylan/chitin deacetylase (PgdA/CDA1 family)
MYRKIQMLVAACFYFSGLIPLMRWWKRRREPELVILNYHRAGGNLGSHMKYLCSSYRPQHLEPALEELYTPKKEMRQASQKTSVVLTFDDGYRDNYSYGVALAKELQVPFTVFLIPGYIESGNCFWWMEAEYILKHARNQEVVIDEKIYHLEQPRERSGLLKAIDQKVRHASNVTEREEFIDSTHIALAVDMLPTPEEREGFPVTWNDVRDMAASGWVSFGAHTMHHPILSYLDSLAEIAFEVETCREILSQQLSHPIRTFAYPVGKSEHIGDAVCKAVEHAGYSWALTTEYGFNTAQTDPYLLRRIEVDIDQHWLLLAAEVAGVWASLSRLRRRLSSFGRSSAN